MSKGLYEKYGKYKWSSRYEFDRKAILKDFEYLKDFIEHYNLSQITFARGITKNKWNIPEKFLIDKQENTARVYVCEGVITTKKIEEATHLLGSKQGEILLTKRKKENKKEKKK